MEKGYLVHKREYVVIYCEWEACYLSNPEIYKWLPLLGLEAAPAHSLLEEDYEIFATLDEATRHLMERVAKETARQIRG
jgi:hypothetical protein